MISQKSLSIKENKEQLFFQVLAFYRIIQQRESQQIRQGERKLWQTVLVVLKDVFGLDPEEEEFSFPLLEKIVSQLAQELGLDKNVPLVAIPQDNKLEELIEEMKQAAALNQEVEVTMAQLMEHYRLDRMAAQILAERFFEQQRVLLQQSLEDLSARSPELFRQVSKEDIYQVSRPLATIIVSGIVQSQPQNSDKEAPSARTTAKKIIARLKEPPPVMVLARRIRRSRISPLSTILEKLPSNAREVVLREIQSKLPQRVAEIKTEMKIALIEDAVDKIEGDLKVDLVPDKRTFAAQLLETTLKTGKQGKIGKQEGLDKSEAERLATIVADQRKPIFRQTSISQTKKLIVRLLGLTGEEQVVGNAIQGVLRKISQEAAGEVQPILEKEIQRGFERELVKRGFSSNDAQKVAKIFTLVRLSPDLYQREISREKIPPQILARLPEKESFSYQEIIDNAGDKLTWEQWEVVWPLVDEEGHLTARGELISRQLGRLSPKEIRIVLENWEAISDEIPFRFDLLQKFPQLIQEAKRFFSPSKFRIFTSFEQRLGSTKIGTKIILPVRQFLGKTVASAGKAIDSGLTSLAKATLPKIAALGGKLLSGAAVVGGKIIAGLTTAVAGVGAPVWVIILIIILIVLIVVVAVGGSKYVSVIQRGLSPSEISIVAGDLDVEGDHLAAVIQRAFKTCGLADWHQITADVLRNSITYGCLVGQGVPRSSLKTMIDSASTYGVLQCVGFAKAAVPEFPGNHDAYWFVDNAPVGWHKVDLASETVAVGDLAVWGPSTRCGGGSCETNSSCCGHIGVITKVEIEDLGKSYLYITQAWGDTGRVTTIKVLLSSPATILKKD